MKNVMTDETRQSSAGAHGQHTSNPGYKPMDHWVVCDSCGFDIRSSISKTTWDNRVVCPADWEPRHPQDFVRSKEDTIAAGDPVRPDPIPINIPVTYAVEQQPVPSSTFNTNTL